MAAAGLRLEALVESARPIRGNPRVTKDELLEIAKKIRYDLTASQQKLSELMRGIAALDLPEEVAATCPHCRLKLSGPNSLAEHLYVSHGGEVPPVWERAEALAAP